MFIFYEHLVLIDGEPLECLSLGLSFLMVPNSTGKSIFEKEIFQERVCCLEDRGLDATLWGQWDWGNFIYMLLKHSTLLDEPKKRSYILSSPENKSLEPVPEWTWREKRDRGFSDFLSLATYPYSSGI